MILKKGLIPPNVDFVKPKEILKLDERKIKVSRSGSREIAKQIDPCHTGSCCSHAIPESYVIGNSESQSEFLRLWRYERSCYS